MPRSATCKGQKVNAIDDDSYLYDYTTEENKRVEVIEINRVQTTTKNEAHVKVENTMIKFFVDSGCSKTLVPLQCYNRAMGQIKPTNIKFRPYGTQQHLQIEGQVKTTLHSERGAKHDTTIYIVKGNHIQPLLGDTDAKALGILTIYPEGAPEKDTEGNTININNVASNLQASGIPIKAEVEHAKEPDTEEQKRIDDILETYTDVFEGKGLMLDGEVQFDVDTHIPPTSAPYRPVPLAYREKLSKHLQELRDQDKIEDVDPTTHNTWISNVVITEKKDTEQIRMSIDMRAANKALKQTKVHVETIKEIRHKLKGATRYSEMDLSHGFHQLPLAEASRDISTFQTHEGLHRFKVLFFGASPASAIFHERIKNALRGLAGCISIHDNILVYGKTPKEHEDNLKACFERLLQKGLNLRRSKCTFGKASVSWFGYIFSASGISADPEKVEAIQKAGPPQSTEEYQEFPTSLSVQCKVYFPISTSICRSNTASKRVATKEQDLHVESRVPASIPKHQKHDR